MTTTNATLETPNVRDLTDTEVTNVSGGANFIGNFARNLLWQMENAPSDAEFLGCSEDGSACSWQSK